MDNDTDFDSAFAEATDTTVDTQQPAEPAAAGGEGEPPASASTEAVDTVDTTEPTAEEKAAAAEVEAASTPPPAKPVEPAATEVVKPAVDPAKPTEPVPQPLDPKFLAAAIAEAQSLAEKNKPAEPAAPAKPLTADDFLTDEDRKAIETFKSEWPTEHVAINKMYDAKLRAELGNYKTQLVTELNGVLAPLFQSVGTVQANSHMGTIRAAHPDAEAIVPSVLEWIKTQPSYVQPGMMQVLDKGNAIQVVELLNDYKKTLATPGAAPETPAPAAEKKGTPKQGADPAAVAALAAVPAAQRPAPAARPSDNDFDAAFAEALAQA